MIVIGALFLSACSSQQEYPKDNAQPIDFPEQFYLQADADMGNNIYQADSESSQILLKVQRSGVLALFSHEHIIASQDVQGYILINEASKQCQTDIFVPIRQLNIDDPALRAKNSLDSTSSLNTFTDANKYMEKTVNANQYPFAQLHSNDCYGALSGKESNVVLTINGVKQQRQLAIKMQQTQDKRLIITGKFSILQTDFGIEPFSLFNDLIKLNDQLDLTYQLVFKGIN